MNMENVSWNMVYEKARNMYRAYHKIEDKKTKADFDKAMGQFMETIIRIHGFVPENVTPSK